MKYFLCIVVCSRCWITGSVESFKQLASRHNGPTNLATSCSIVKETCMYRQRMTGIYLYPISAGGKAAEDVASPVTRFLEMSGQVTIVCKWRCLLRKSQRYCPVFSILVTVLPYVRCSDYLVKCPGYFLIPRLGLNFLGEHLYFFLFD
jgi:hypothetical protein